MVMNGEMKRKKKEKEKSILVDGDINTEFLTCFSIQLDVSNFNLHLENYLTKANKKKNGKEDIKK